MVVTFSLLDEVLSEPDKIEYRSITRVLQDTILLVIDPCYLKPVASRLQQIIEALKDSSYRMLYIAVKDRYGRLHIKYELPIQVMSQTAEHRQFHQPNIE